MIIMNARVLLVVLLQIVLTQIVFAQKIDIDLRYSAILTTGVDIYQTNNFNKYGLHETWNPAAKIFLNKGVTAFTLASVISIHEIDRYIQNRNKNDQKWLYAGWFAIESLAVLNNRKLGCPGIPIAVISFKF